MKSDTELRRDLEERLKEAVEAQKRAETEATRLKRHTQAIQEFLATMNHDAMQSSESLFRDLPPGSTPIASMTMREASRTMLRQHGHMTTRELFEVLEQAGKRIGGKVPTETLSATLRSYSDTFKRTRDSKWAVIEESVEKA